MKGGWKSRLGRWKGDEKVGQEDGMGMEKEVWEMERGWKRGVERWKGVGKGGTECEKGDV